MNIAWVRHHSHGWIRANERAKKQWKNWRIKLNFKNRFFIKLKKNTYLLKKFQNHMHIQWRKRFCAVAVTIPSPPRPFSFEHRPPCVHFLSINVLNLSIALLSVLLIFWRFYIAIKHSIEFLSIIISTVLCPFSTFAIYWDA